MHSFLMATLLSPDAVGLALRAVTLLALLLVADHLIERRPFFGRPFWALVDSGVHGLVAVLVTAPIIWSALNPWQLLALAFLAGTLVDLDHFLAAGPRSLWAATHLAERPPTHSLTFALLASGGGYLFAGSLTNPWAVFAALTSHVLRDASVGTAPILWPLGDWRIPRWVYYVRAGGADNGVVLGYGSEIGSGFSEFPDSGSNQRALLWNRFSATRRRECVSDGRELVIALGRANDWPHKATSSLACPP